MNTLIMWGGYGIAVIVAAVAALLLQKKGGGHSQDVEQIEELSEKISMLEQELSETKDSLVGKEQALKAAQQDRDKNVSALEALENDFESKMDDVVQSSIQKIAHAEQAKEDAVQAADGNYEAAAAAHATIKEKEQIIADLEKQLSN
ncbi:hypothetical protein [Desulforhopalus sp. 52FAK]